MRGAQGGQVHPSPTELEAPRCDWGEGLLPKPASLSHLSPCSQHPISQLVEFQGRGWSARRNGPPLGENGGVGGTGLSSRKLCFLFISFRGSLGEGHGH